MKKIIYVFLFLTSIIAYSCTQNSVACTAEAKLCPDGSYVGRTGPNCEFAKCPDASPTQKSNNSAEKIYCNSKQRGAGFCIEIYQPVCGWFDNAKIQCIKYPCAQTFSNSCFACQNANVLYWTEGECPK